MSNLLVLAKVSYCLLTYFFASYEIVLILPLLELDHAVEKIIQNASADGIHQPAADNPSGILWANSIIKLYYGFLSVCVYEMFKNDATNHEPYW